MRGVVVLIATLAGCGRWNFESRARPDSDLDSAITDGSAPIGWTRIAAGDETTCGIYKSRAYCWGRGSNNEIGDGNATNRSSPAEVALPAGTVSEIVQGEGHGCAVLDDTVYCWGLAAIGNGTPASPLPRMVSLPASIASLSAGGGYACAAAGGNLYCWGEDPNGALGNGSGGPTLVPQMVTLPGSVVSVDAANDHTIALLADGRVFIWGHNDNGVFGNGSTTTPATSDLPVQTTAISGTLPSIAGWHACGLVAGAVACWGTGSRGELGNGQMVDRAVSVQVIGMQGGVTALDTGGGPSNNDASCAALAGAVACWGAGIYGRLGNGLTSDQATPQAVQNLPADVVELAVGFEHACARSANGTVRCWGRGDLGQLGDGNTSNSLVPVVVPLPP